MCNLYSITTAVEAMRNLFEVAPERDHLGNAEPLDAVWPKYPAPVVRRTDGGERHARRREKTKKLHVCSSGPMNSAKLQRQFLVILCKFAPCNCSLFACKCKSEMFIFDH